MHKLAYSHSQTALLMWNYLERVHYIYCLNLPGGAGNLHTQMSAQKNVLKCVVLKKPVLNNVHFICITFLQNTFLFHQPFPMSPPLVLHVTGTIDRCM